MSREPGLDRLLSALTADASPEERAGRDAALAAYREAAANRVTVHQPRWRRGFRPRPWLLPSRLTIAAAAVAIVVAALATAAYTSVLPGPAQDAAHTVLAPLGVPGNRGASPSGGAGGTSATPSSAAVTTTSGPPGRAAGDVRLTLAAPRARVAPGSVVVFSGRVTAGGHAAAGRQVYLVERLAGTASWRVVASGVTGPEGGFSITSPPLTQTAVFRAAAATGAHSAPVRVTVPKAGRTAPAG